jgi:NTP pyrophosphatase (non-canonical NTP hydrolase)
MTISEYQIEAKRTCSDLGSKYRNVLHTSSGFLTEIGEVIDVFKKRFAYKKPIDYVNLKEEIGDCLWYDANECTLLGINFSKEDEEEIDFIFLDMKSSISSIVDNLDEDSKVEQTLEIIIEFIHEGRKSAVEVFAFYKFLCFVWGIDFSDALQTNINKLRVRYPEKFTTEAAINRNLDAEREELEK